MNKINIVGYIKRKFKEWRGGRIVWNRGSGKIGKKEAKIRVSWEKKERNIHVIKRLHVKFKKKMYDHIPSV